MLPARRGGVDSITTSITFSGQSGNYITLSNAALSGAEVNGTGATYGAVLGSSATTAQGYAIEDKIQHAVDLSGVGFIRVNSGNVFVTPNSFVSPATNNSGPTHLVSTRS